jgi:hypothetical protein
MKHQTSQVNVSRWCNAFVLASVLTLLFVVPAAAKDFSATADAGTGVDRAVFLDFTLNEVEAGRHLIFALGPTLAQQGAERVAQDPKLRLFKGGELLDEVDDWESHASATAVAEMTKAGGGLPTATEAAMVLNLTAGTYRILVENNAPSFGKVQFGVTRDTVQGGEVPPTDGDGDDPGIKGGLWLGNTSSFQGCANLSPDGTKITLNGSGCRQQGNNQNQNNDPDAINIQIEQWITGSCGDDDGYLDWDGDIPINDNSFEVVDNTAQPWFPVSIRVTGTFENGVLKGRLFKTIDSYWSSGTCEGAFELRPAN